MSVTCCPAAACDSSECLQLTERESKVCATICTSPEPVTFSSLRRSLGYHQEVVSRILKRLVRHGAVERVRGKYRRAC